MLIIINDADAICQNIETAIIKSFLEEQHGILIAQKLELPKYNYDELVNLFPYLREEKIKEAIKIIKDFNNNPIHKMLEQFMSIERYYKVQIAKEYGIGEAIFIHNLAFWIKKNQSNNKHYYKGYQKLIVDKKL